MIWTGRGLALIAVLFWGASFIWAKQVMEWLPPFAASGTRYGVAAMLLLLVAARYGNPFRILPGHWLGYLLLGILGITVFQCVLFSGLRLTSAVSGSVIMALTPALTALGATTFLGERLSGRAMIGMVVSILGALLAVLGDNPRGIAGLSLDWGEPLVLVAALCFAFYTVASRRLMRHDVPALINTAVVVTIGAVFLLPVAIPAIPAALPRTATPLVALACLVLGSTVIGYLAWNRAIQLIGVGQPNMIFNFMPVMTMLVVTLLGEPPWPEQVIGAALVIAGISFSMLPAETLHRHAPGVQPVH
ncbi:MAG TPA: DMT family transporter [Acetobacteraceae bacterium]|nr:DMT family transporter [Acetobacteraceae bacterium]